ncbi:TadE/TadG family type IV pilus assembly protein [Microbacterium oleivorans]|uniref:TadE/TadG family type IV pilus assembly protein n=1 Tax=Microbacterium oleivorans TaxID=273677 RepID=UPI00080E588F|nr:TadE family protein [Microbacterium oleivorans]
MPPQRASSDRLRDDEGGSAALEFIVGGVVLLVPIVYLIVALGMIQSHSLGVESASRHIARAVASAESVEDADHRAATVLDSLVQEYDLDEDALEVDVSCVDAATTCPTAGAIVRVTVSSSVALPLVPPVLGLDDAARVGVESSSVQKVSRYWRDG